mmetsp:Transcript_16918/g.30337  ORF Transcript_16918/g.30337 Transcript_16918/m.30337 type:complete len:135 (-) Transcript_16918:255-659(-)
MSGGVSKLKFRIVSCTSEDPDFAATELLKHGPATKGWTSARFCDYPQEIILQMSVPARVKQLQFLSHQFKVSSKIELYTYYPETPGSVPPLDSITADITNVSGISKTMGGLLGVYLRSQVDALIYSTSPMLAIP